MLNNVEFRDVQEIAKVEKVKIVACDGKGRYFHKHTCAMYFNFHCCKNNIFK